jgi:hypothetical protein
MLILSARKHADFNIKPRLIPPTIFSVLGDSMGWLVTSEVGATAMGGLVGALFAALVYLLALWIWHRSYLLDSVHLSVRGLRGALKGSL